MSCYIMQHDKLCPALNVMELMEFAANLKIGNKLSSDEKKQLVRAITHKKS